MNRAHELLRIARELADVEGPHMTAGRLVTVAALILAEQGVSADATGTLLRCAFMAFDTDALMTERPN